MTQQGQRKQFFDVRDKNGRPVYMDQVLPMQTEEQVAFFDRVMQDVESDIHKKAGQIADMAVPGHADESEARKAYGKAYHQARNSMTENYKDLTKLVNAQVNDRINRGDDIPSGISPEVDAKVAAIKEAREAAHMSKQDQERTSQLVNAEIKSMAADYAKEHGIGKGEALGKLREEGTVPAKDASMEDRANWYQSRFAENEPEQGHEPQQEKAQQPAAMEMA